MQGGLSFFYNPLDRAEVMKVSRDEQGGVLRVDLADQLITRLRATLLISAHHEHLNTKRAQGLCTGVADP
jgi:hypothetical protein